MRQIVIVVHNLRSCHNVGSLLRTAEGIAVEKVILSGYTPHPAVTGDTRMPHEVIKIDKQIHKTALGAESLVAWEYLPDIIPCIEGYHAEGWHIAAIEQDSSSIDLPDFSPPQKIILIVGREVEGVEPEVLAAVDSCLEIPMYGQKESFNVVQAAAMALYHCRFS